MTIKPTVREKNGTILFDVSYVQCGKVRMTEDENICQSHVMNRGTLIIKANLIILQFRRDHSKCRRQAQDMVCVGYH